MSESSNVLDQAIAQIADETVRARVAREVELLRGSRRFGLVFDRHLPESVRLPGHPIRKGVRVGLRDESSDERWRVLRFTDSTRQVAMLDGDMGEVPVKKLVVIREFGEPVFPGLRSVESIANGPADAPWHTVINGENFHVLQALRSTHHEKLDLIYIDPPYNTGGKTSWLYNDKFVDKADRGKSSKWLSFMERRLLIARDLLKPSGAIVVSIGDDEQHRLRMLMDQVFGIDNFVSVLTVEMSTTSGPKTTNAQQGTIVKNVEYVLIYRKSVSFDTDVKHTPLYDGVEKWDANYPLWLNDDGTTESVYDRLDEEPAVRADIERFELTASSGKRKGTFIGAPGMDILLAASEPARTFILNNLQRIGRTDTPPVSGKSVDVPIGRWVEHRTDNRSYRLTRSSQGKIWQIYTLDRNYRTSDDYAPRFGRTVIRGDLWRGFHSDMGHVSNQGGVGFANGKKPIRLIQQLIRWANNSPDAVILDFFAGSGSTAHAVMEMNATDGGRRQCILATNNEVAIDVAKDLRQKGLHPGDPAWEGEGVFRAVTQPRIRNVLESGTSANIEFFELTYLDPGSVRRGNEFSAIAPMLWLESGAVGPCIESAPDEDWTLSDSYGVLFSIDALRPFVDAVAEAVEEGNAPAYAYLVTDSPTEYQTAAERLPVGIETVQLYSDYLSNYTINTEGRTR